MVKNKALPDSSRPCKHPHLVMLSLSLSLSLCFSLSLPRRLGPIKAGLTCLPSLSWTPFILRVSPGSCQGWTPALMSHMPNSCILLQPYCSPLFHMKLCVWPSLLAFPNYTLLPWGCRGWQAARTWVSVSPEMVGFPAPIR